MAVQAEERRRVESEPARQRTDGNEGPGRPDSDTQSKPAKASDPPTARDFYRKHKLAVIIATVIAAAAIAGGVIYWLDARHYETTDDAFIDTHTLSISSQVAGAITQVAVTDNQLVQPNQLLVTIDRRDYEARLVQAKAQVEQAVADEINYKAQIDAQAFAIEQAQKTVTSAQAALTFSQAERDRAQKLVQTGSGTVQTLQRNTSDFNQKQASLAGAEAALTQSQKQIAVLRAQLQSASGRKAAAEGQLDQADADLARTTVLAPVAGRITMLTAAKGNYATAGQALMMIVPLDVWITANFKESQLADMRPGQPVTVRVDAYPSRKFQARVDSIQAGSGTAFSLLPAQNATGNFVKIVQRVPVKLVFDQRPDVLLGPGMSLEPSVKVR